MNPAPTAQVPIYGAGHSPPALRRAARLDGWIGNAYTPEDALHFLEQLRKARAAAGTLQRGDYDAVVAVQADPFDLDVYRRLEDAGVTTILCVPWLIAGGAEQSKPPPAAAGRERGLHEIDEEAEYEGPLEDKRRAIEEFAERVIGRM
jgi:alkanesulfonate monooxygenase SsuD/methylene tetrahydromethanopterin reductase-like flavin-dependent oxidoreductase (luciferase family)